MDQKEIETLKKAGKIASQTVTYARSFIKKDMNLLEIAETIESKILELGAKPAFPVNLSINETAAHATPAHNDEQTAFGLLKVDIGVHLDGLIADTAFSIDLEDLEENKELIEAAESSLQAALEEVQKNKELPLRKIGSTISDTMKKKGATPIINLSGHSIDHYDLHAGITIPNYDNAQEKTLEPGLYAIEPFSTSGSGSVKDSKPSGIYNITDEERPVRDPFAREVLKFIKEEYVTLPFCSRWIVKKFGTRALIALKRIEDAGITHHYAQLVEASKHKVAQAEHSILITDKEVIITTKA